MSQMGELLAFPDYQECRKLLRAQMRRFVTLCVLDAPVLDASGVARVRHTRGWLI